MNPCEDILRDYEEQPKQLKPLSSGSEFCTPGKTWGAGVRSSYLIHYVISGTGEFFCGQNKFNVKKGQIFVIFPNTIVKYRADKTNPWHYSWVVFDGDEIKDVFNYLGISIKNPVFTVSDGEKIKEIIDEMPCEITSDICKNLKFSSLLYSLASLLADSGIKKENKENRYIREATGFIAAHYHSDITVDKIAEKIGISRKYLFAIFKNSVGISPKDYIIDLRIKKACEFLKDKNLSIENVAYSIGYNDPFTFSKIFKKKTGMSPSVYRSNL